MTDPDFVLSTLGFKASVYLRWKKEKAEMSGIVTVMSSFGEADAVGLHDWTS